MPTPSRGLRKRARDFLNQTFGRVVVDGFEQRRDKSGVSRTWAFCRCSCGKTKWIPFDSLRRGVTKSCGCFATESKRKRAKPNRGTKEYKIWGSMLTRCRNPRSGAYRWYGARGVTVCQRWESFDAFFEDMGKCPSKDHSIERRDVNGNYEPSNCYWVPLADQSKNKRNTRRLTWRGRTEIMADWAREFCISGARLSEYIHLHGEEAGMDRASSATARRERREACRIQEARYWERRKERRREDAACC